MNIINELLSKIKNLQKSEKTLLIAIDGRGGSGKSTLAELLKYNLGSSSIFPIDDYDQRRGMTNFRYEVILPLKEGKSIKLQRYDWDKKKLGEWYEFSPSNIIIIEGINTLQELWYRDYDFRIWVDCPSEIAVKRGLKRDQEVYHRDTTKEWLNEWKPKEDAYIKSQSPQDKADYIVDGTIKFE